MYFNNNIPLYNIRIFRSYIDYVKDNYPYVSIEKILKYSGVTKPQYNDLGYWCNQHQMNRLQEILINETCNKNISRETGRSLLRSRNVIALYVFSFINTNNIIHQIKKLYNKLSRAAIIEINSLGENKYEFISRPALGVKEELYQCKNRIGSFEGLFKLFLHKYPEIEHPNCLHKGSAYCRYIISWDKADKIWEWARIRYQSLILATILSVFSFMLGDWFSCGMSSPVSETWNFSEVAAAI